MALGDISIVGPAGLNRPSSYRFRTELNTTVINPGEPVKAVQGTGTNYVLPSADAEPASNVSTFAGIASSLSTQTASADGVVDVVLATPGMVYRAKAKSAAAIDTDAELLGVLFDYVLLDLTSSAYTVDTGSASANNGLIIIGGDIVNGTVDFLVKTKATLAGGSGAVA